MVYIQERKRYKRCVRRKSQVWTQLEKWQPASQAKVSSSLHNSEKIHFCHSSCQCLLCYGSTVRLITIFKLKFMWCPSEVELRDRSCHGAITWKIRMNLGCINLGKSIPGREKSWWKVPELGMSQRSLKNIRGFNKSREWTQRKMLEMQ